MRSEIRIADLKGRPHGPRRLMNVKVPVHLAAAIADLAQTFGVSKTEVVTALLNEGLTVAARRLGKQRLRRVRPPGT